MGFSVDMEKLKKWIMECDGYRCAICGDEKNVSVQNFMTVCSECSEKLNYYTFRSIRDDYSIGGVDEVGVSSIAGDLYSCCFVTVGPFIFNQDIKDSKKLTRIQREKFFEDIKKYCSDGSAFYTIGITKVKEIEKLKNIKKASIIAMKRAVNQASKKLGHAIDVLYVDWYSLKVPAVRQISEPKADEKFRHVAIASIIAKVIRDKYMRELHKKFPVYDWENNVGYRSKKHFEAIKKYGVSKYHRKYLLKI